MNQIKIILLVICSYMTLISCHCSQKILNGNDKFIHTIPINGIDRSFIVDLPNDYDCSIDYPVVVAFHGTGQQNEKAWDDWGWKEKGESEDIITVYPQALTYTFDNSQTPETKWDDGQLSDPSNPQNLNPANQVIEDDLAFVDAFIAFLKLNYSTDHNQYFATGFSNGGNFVWRLAMERSNTFESTQ